MGSTPNWTSYDLCMSLLTHEEIKAFSEANPHVYCEYESYGKLVFDPLQGTKHYDPWWALLQCDPEIQRYYAWFLKKRGMPVMLSKLWGPHISVVKHEEPAQKDMWGLQGMEIEVKFYYTNYIRSDNGAHAWLDCYSPEMSQLRRAMGLPAKEWFHFTIGRYDR
jgi:hypothetical protein